MHLFFVPPWASIESAHRAHALLENTSQICFALLLLFELAAIIWKNRATALSLIGLLFFAFAIICDHYAAMSATRQNELHEVALKEDFEKQIVSLRTAQPSILKGSATINFGTVTDGGCSDDHKFALIGAVPGDAPSVGWPRFLRGLSGDAYVSEANTVSVRVCNLSGAPIVYNSVPVAVTIVKK